MQFESLIQQRGEVTFPEFQGDRLYMVPFYKASGLPDAIKRWQPTVDAMLDGVDTAGPIYLMVDESPVIAGNAQRRPGVHIDGYWVPEISAHGGGGGHRPNSGGGLHAPIGRHRAMPPLAPYDKTPKKGPKKGKRLDSAWAHADFSEHEAILLASTVTAACGYVGQFEGPINEGGDCSHVDLKKLQQIEFTAGSVFAGNVTSLHESLPVTRDCVRQLVRLNVPGWTFH